MNNGSYEQSELIKAQFVPDFECRPDEELSFVPSTKPIATDASIITTKSVLTDVWAAQYKLYSQDNKPYSNRTSDLLVVGSSQKSCAIAAYQYNGDTYIAHRVGNVLNVKDEGMPHDEKTKERFGETVEVVDFVDYVKPASLTRWFAHCNRLKEIQHIDRLDTSAVQNFAGMFSDCESLVFLNLSNFKTSNALDMSCMFAGCCSLTSLDLSSFDTSNVVNMSYMFCRCRSLISLDLSSFDTSNVTGMSHMFNECRALTDLDLSSFNASHAIDMSYMFCRCVSLRSLDISGFNAPQAKDLTSMFEACLRLRRIEGRPFLYSKEAESAGMYRDCRSLGRIVAIGYNVADIFILLLYHFVEAIKDHFAKLVVCFLVFSGGFLLNFLGFVSFPAFLVKNIVVCIKVSFYVMVVLGIFRYIASRVVSRYRIYDKDGYVLEDPTLLITRKFWGS